MSDVDDDTLTPLDKSGPDNDVISEDAYVKRSRRAFVTFGLAGVAGYVGFNRLQNAETAARAPQPLRSMLDANARIWGALERDGATSRTYSLDAAEDIRVNGRLGLRSPLPTDWSIRIVGVDGADVGTVSLADVQSLPTHDIAWKHKCIEGWSNIVHWTGSRFFDFVEQFAPDQTDWKWVSLSTPDEEYYVGLDRYTMLHSQTLLAWALNGETLDDEHGAPVRLATPLKYGIKQLKRIATIEFTNERPPDYWYERGYDYHAGF